MNLVRSARAVPAVGLAVAVAVLAAAAAGCSAARPGLVVNAATRAAAPVAAKSSAPVAPTPAVSHLPAPCQTDELAVSPGRQGTRSGSKEATFSLTNSGAQACTVSGAPQITPQGPLTGQSAGMEASLAVSQLPFTLPSSADVGPAGGILLLPGQKAYFDLGWYGTSSVVCETSDAFGFDAPASATRTGELLVSFPFGPMCNGMFFASSVYSASPAS